MTLIALVTDAASIAEDSDMPLLRAACNDLGLATEVCDWDDPEQDWSRFSHVVLRSPWDYTGRLDEFLVWCAAVDAVSQLLNPLPALRWSLDKHYLRDLAAASLPVIPCTFIELGTAPLPVLTAFLDAHPRLASFVAKPTVGASSKNVQRFERTQQSAALDHINNLLETGHSVILQPYLASIEQSGESDLIYFNGSYSHAIRKAALLGADGTTHAPTMNFLSACEAGDDEKAVAQAALTAAAQHLGLDRALPYARVDLIRADDGQPQVLELEIVEPSLSLPLVEGSAMRFARTLAAIVEAGAT